MIIFFIHTFLNDCIKVICPNSSVRKKKLFVCRDQKKKKSLVLTMSLRQKIILRDLFFSQKKKINNITIVLK